MSQALAAGASVDPQEVARFSRIAAEWWDPRGPLGALHKLNPVRLGFIRDNAVRRFGRDDFARAPFAGLSLLDVGCGGGLLCEPMRRLGFDVTGVDASPENIGVASAHAAEMGLDIAYRCVTAESLRAEGARFDVVLNMEVVEHTADPGQFLRDTSALVAPGGMMVIATLNRTLKSFALAKVAAEYVLGWAPRGAHDWRKFLKPDEIKDHLASEPVEVRGPFGVVYSPMSDSWSLAPDTDINFMMTALKGAQRG